MYILTLAIILRCQKWLVTESEGIFECISKICIYTILSSTWMDCFKKIQKQEDSITRDRLNSMLSMILKNFYLSCGPALIFHFRRLAKCKGFFNILVKCEYNYFVMNLSV